MPSLLLELTGHALVGTTLHGFSEKGQLKNMIILLHRVIHFVPPDGGLQQIETLYISLAEIMSK